ncbi:putative lipase atg15 [Mortierella antarctica]|nr:putative lipase atg15 [Mortierella antarctica]
MRSRILLISYCAALLATPFTSTPATAQLLPRLPFDHPLQQTYKHQAPFTPPQPPHNPPLPQDLEQHTLQLQHIFAHGAPGAKTAKVFRHLRVDDETRAQMAQVNLLNQGSFSPGSSFEHTLSDTLFPYPSTPSYGQSESPPRQQRVPDAKDHATVVSMVRMALDCYVDPKRQGWVDIGDEWDVETEIGWLEAGLRGYIFSSEDDKTVVIGIKGTSLKLFGTGGGPTGNNDKLNDNKMFSCCCGKVDRTWWGVCGCYVGGIQCSQQCLVEDAQKDRDESESYYGIGLKVVDAARALYPDADIFLTGHSLGGSVASLLGVTKGYPVFTFQSPGDMLYGKRVGIVKEQLTEADLDKLPIWQFGHTADPIYMGTCNGATSTCYTAGYAMEAKCHLGKTCVYDTMKELGWHQNIQAHTIFTFINVVENWAKMTEGKGFPEVPECTAQADCQDCSNWEFV